MQLARADEESELTMRYARVFLSTVILLMWSPAFSGPNDPIRVELNLAESVQNKCRLSFLIENKSETPIERLTPDLAIFNREGIIQRRLVAEMGPVYRSKTIIKTFEIEGECGQIGSILINDITVCTPGDPGLCLDRLVLSSRVPSIALFR
jgi:hypothetical protein